IIESLGDVILRPLSSELKNHSPEDIEMVCRQCQMENFDTEVKFYLSEVNPVRRRIVELGADFKGRVFETNLRFEDADTRLFQKKSLLRLRKDIKTTLTFKSEPPFKDDEFKTLRELEVEVSDFAVMKHILESLGFHEEQVYEKWRETFVLSDTNLCLDTMPFGDFLEIEGPKKSIKELASQIGLKWHKRILLNYLTIFDIIGKELNLGFSDVTFENFKNIRFDLAEHPGLLDMDVR
ncbi:MAG: class IV adenylate cyclase, partial [Desulfobacteraceae bacterium]|nr:class IV adenylate cyclase [Desulfobacteraceae bacterium]